MPRTARTKSLSNIYHIMMRGINKQVIFQSDADRRHFITILGECKEISGFKLHAFCLMPNHIHLLLEPAGDEPLEIIFKRIGSRYAVWYNRKYQRVGHLFQDRFRSENVETDMYYRTVLRYILQNPMKAGMEKKPGTYRWSSYLAYEKGSGLLTDTDYAEKMFGGREELIEFVQQNNNDEAMDDTETHWRMNDEEAEELIRKITGCATAEEIREMGKKKRDKCITEMYLNELSINQISKLLGMARSTIQGIIKENASDSVEERKKIVFLEPDASEYDYSDEIW